MSPPPTDAHQLDEVLGAYLEAVEAGRAPNRQEFLDAHPDLAGELEAFLTDQDRFDSLMAPLGSSAPASRPRSIPDGEVRAGQVFGNYELLEEIARGGMGVVYKARQFLGEGTPRPYRIVALKMIAEGAGGTAAEVQRFRLEASAVAHLDHPNIVPLYEVGACEVSAGSPRPYFSMKLVEGGSLGRHLGRFKNRPRDAARLILSVARAVEYAHQRGILHRDLKPGNILLEGRLDGPLDQLRGLVADFGLAKRLPVAESASGFQSSHTRPLTQTGTAVGTPAYMPPEQALGRDVITTAADVYSLGAILYELLAGRPPFRMPTGLETLLEVLEREPVPPGKHCPGLDRDLETICLKCLQKEPDKRYATAGALADDLQRYLNGEPIHARPIGRVARLARWCRRQPVLATLVAAVVLSVTAGLIAVSLLWQRAENHLARAEEKHKEARKHAAEADRQRTLAEQHAGRAAANAEEAERGFRDAHAIVHRFCIQLSENQLSNVPGLQPLRKQLLEAGLRYLQKFARRKADDPKLRNQMADTHFRIALLTNIVGTRKEALESYRRALALYRDLHQNDDKKRDQRLMIARTLSNMSNVLRALHRFDEATGAQRESSRLLEALGKEHPRDPQIQQSLAMDLANRAIRLRQAGKPREALPLLLCSRGILEQLARRWPKQAEYRRQMAQGFYNEAPLRQSLGQPEKVLPCYLEARQRLEKLVAADRDNAWLAFDLARTYRQTGIVYQRLGKNVSALAFLDKACRICEEVARANRKVTVFHTELADLQGRAASLCLATRQPKRALDYYRQCRATLRRLVTEHAEGASARLGLAQACHNVGTVYRTLNQPAEARRSFQEARLAFEDLIARRPRRAHYLNYLAGTVNCLADVLQKLNRYEEALKTFEYGVRRGKEALALRPTNSAYRRDLSALLSNLARAHRLAKRPDKAVALSLERRNLWTGNPDELYKVIRDFLLAAQLAKHDSPEQRKYHGLALETLDLALRAGYKNFENLRANPKLAVLRQRAEFRRILQAFEPKSE